MRWCIYINVYNCGDYCDVSFCILFIWVYMLYINIDGIDSLFIEFVKV